MPEGVNPFDYLTFDVKVQLKTPSGTVQVPAFYDGGIAPISNGETPPVPNAPNAIAPFLWKMRFAPREKGEYKVISVTLNGVIQDVTVCPRKWKIDCPVNDFIRIDSDKRHYRFDDKKPYYPIGHNHATTQEPGNPTGNGDVRYIIEDFVEMGKTGQNWSRVWMDPIGFPATLSLWWTYACSTTPVGLVYPGYIDIPTAERWDQIIDAAEENGIYIQVAMNDSALWNNTILGAGNWDNNPWNANNTFHGPGYNCAPAGFLQNIDDFFTNPTSLAYWLRVVYYTVARWGYSPNIMSFETFKEIDFSQYYVDTNDAGVPAQWNQQIIDFIHKYDFNHHLITGGPAFEAPDNTMFQEMDMFNVLEYIPNTSSFIQYFSQVPPVMNYGVFTIPPGTDRPIQITEFGPFSSPPQTVEEIAYFNHQGLWASAMRWDLTAAAFYGVDQGPVVPNLNEDIGRFATFAHLSGMDKNFCFNNVDVKVTTSKLYNLVINTPFYQAYGINGANNVNPYPYNFEVTKQGISPNYAFSNPLLQGSYGGVNTFFNQVATTTIFKLCNEEPFQVNVTLLVVNSEAATLEFILDGNIVAQYPNPDPSSTYTVDIPAGKHTLSINNPGTDYLVLGDITFTNYAYGLSSVSRATEDEFVSWIYKRENLLGSGPIKGKIELPKLIPGDYTVGWYNTSTGELIKETIEVTGKKQSLKIPPVDTDIALYVKKEK